MDEQLKRWLEGADQNLSEKTIIDIAELKNIVAIIKTYSTSIINLAKASNTVELSNETVTVNKKMFLDFVDGKFEEK